MRGGVAGADGFSETDVLEVFARVFGISGAPDDMAAIRLARSGDLAAIRAALPLDTRRGDRRRRGPPRRGARADARSVSSTRASRRVREVDARFVGSLTEIDAAIDTYRERLDRLAR